MLRVGILPSEAQAVGCYRLIWPARALVDQGEIELIEFPRIDLEMQPHPAGAYIRGIQNMPDIDVLVMQRTTHSLVAESIPHFQRKGVAVVIDVDDDLQHLPPGHSLRRWHDPALNPEQSWRGLKRACALADVV